MASTTTQTAPLTGPDASGADGANGATDRKPRAGKRARQPQSVEESRQEFERLVSIPLSERTAAQNKRIRTLGNRPENTQAGQPQPQPIQSKPEAKPQAAPKPPKAEAPKLVTTPADIHTALVAARTTYGRASLTAELVKIYRATDGHNVIWKAEKGGKAGTGEVVPAYLPALETLLRSIKDGTLQPERKATGAVGAAGAGPRLTLRGQLDEAEARLDAIARLLHDNWGSVKPAAVRDQLAAIVGTPKPEEVK